jgi:hypothetical protein
MIRGDHDHLSTRRHEDIWIAVETLREILQTDCRQEERYSSSGTVT